MRILLKLLGGLLLLGSILTYPLLSLAPEFVILPPMSIATHESSSEAVDNPAEELTETDPTLSLEEALDRAVGYNPSVAPDPILEFVPCTMGLLTYFNQGDSRWADTLYGPSDLMRSHGCGPTAIAMIVSSYTGTYLTPPQAAKWASDNGYCSSGEGSKHALIPDGLTYFGLKVTSLEDRSTESVLSAVKNGKLVVALMNKGHFTNGGHFLLLTQVTEDGELRIADPASQENSMKSWDPEFILKEVRSNAEAGGPLWAVEIIED